MGANLQAGIGDGTMSESGTCHACGRECNTAHCPVCGKRQQDPPTIDGLYRFLCKTREAKRARVKDFQAKHQCSQTESEKFYLSDMVNKNQRELEKYSAWADQLLAVMAD